ncbi:MAG: helix-turn-helix domain-containing protein [Candidatus Dormibacteraeota bacterium]|uniref:Helix-turn-helix domain-containing protein n=2 Tax=Candidatus Dormiibacter inghamiae TaxID=3127013 RepID=A0A934KBV9_9BACT|nr:helix-turn-helix domain-containing protein [Candidatus Dormibacteraeota bacterium]MBJ7605652.1 helix-turn-helix domain-containing protein [Candidatus Dormibacteraeota bacterium]
MSSYPGSETTTRQELSAFLKSRRARLNPETIGLRNGRRRRTPGLRREEVADLAGVGLTWYTWLEQGRDIRVSAQVLGAISRALQLEPAERTHLFRLGGQEPPSEPATACMSPRMLRVLECWDPFPAYVTGRRREVLAWNRASEVVYGWSALPDHRRNSLWRMFMVADGRRLLLDWEREAELMVAAFRADAGRDLTDPDYQELINDLIEGSSEFAALWRRQDVHGRPEGLKRLKHPELGRLDLEFTTYQVGEQPSLRLHLFTPARDGPTEARLRVAVDQPAAQIKAAFSCETLDEQSRAAAKP